MRLLASAGPIVVPIRTRLVGQLNIHIVGGNLRRFKGMSDGSTTRRSTERFGIGGLPPAKVWVLRGWALEVIE